MISTRTSLSRGLAVAALAGVLATAPILSAPTLAASGPPSVADLAEGLLDSVVNISTTQLVAGAGGGSGGENGMPQLPPGTPFEEFFNEFFKNRGGQGDNRPRRTSSLGSGFVIDASGIIVTNNHVIDGADEVVVNFNDGSKLSAEIVGRDKKVDIAVLRVKPEKPLKAVKFADATKIRVGDWVLAIGNPFGLGGSVTVGIVSARNRDINSGPYDNYLQTDAAINRGNSGGPLFDMEGNVVGINTAIISPSGGSIGIGFSVPADTAKPIVDQLLQFGETRRGWLGVRIQPVTDDIAESLGMDSARGALIAGIDDKGPAKPAGLEPGDVVLTFDGKMIREMRDLPRIVADTPVGKKVEVSILRRGEEITKTVEIGRLDEGPQKAELEVPKAEPEKPVVTKLLGLQLSEMSEDLRKQYKIGAEVKGVVVTDVDPASAAADKQLRAGDVIVEVAQEAVNQPADIATRVEALKKEGKRSALLLLSNGAGELRFVAIALE
jgi:serine protease Do